MSRLKRALLFAVPSSKSWRLAAIILLAIGVTTAGKQTQPIAGGVAFGNINGTACDPGTTVQTDNGAVCGIVVTGINAWLGIPFAAPPVEDLRWAPPEAAAPWSGVREATAYASQCLQATGGDEDCLYLNVWAPPGARVWLSWPTFTAADSAMAPAPATIRCSAGRATSLSLA